MNILVIIAALIFALGRAHGYSYGEWGVGAFHPAADSNGQVKFVEFGYGEKKAVFNWQAGIGGWADNTDKPKWHVENSVYTHLLLGLETERKEGLYASYLIGPAYISRTDGLLGSNLQISHEVGLGLVDSRGVHIGLVAKHFSNAGVVRPNWGRNFVGLRVEF